MSDARLLIVASAAVSRRRMLRLAGVGALAAVGAGLLSACQQAAQPAPTPAPKPTSAPPPAPAAPAPTSPLAAAPKPTTAPAPAPAAAPTIAPAAAKPSGQPVKLRYALWDNNFIPVLEPQFKAFTAKNPSITVEPEIQPFGDHFTKLQREFAGGNAADVFHVNPANAAAYAFGKQLLAVDERMTKDGLKKDDFVKESIEIYEYLDGKLYTVPFYLDSMGIAYNEDLFAKAGRPTPKELQSQGKWDWPALRETALAMSSGDGPNRQHGFVMRNDGQGGYFNFIFANDGELYNADRTKSAMDQPPAMEALQYMADFILKDKSSPDPQALTSQDHNARFLSQKVAMIPAGTFNVVNFRANVKDFKWDVVQMPKGKKQVGFVAGLTHGIYAKTQNPDAAWELVKFLSAPEQIKEWGVKGVGVPALKSQSGTFATPPPANIKAFVDALVGAKANRQNLQIGTTGVPLGVRDSVIVAGRGREIGEIFAGRKSVQDAMKTLADEMNKALAETKA